jgi:nucleoid-associated protein YgaU
MNVLSSGAALKPGDAVTSANGHYRLELQTDGNLVLTGPTGLAWDSGTRGEDVVTAEMQTDGNFVLYTADRGVAWTAETTGPGAHLVVQDDRNIVILAADGATVLWTPNCHVTEAERATEEQAIAEEAAQEEARRAAAAAPPAPAPSATPAPQTYTVQRGDTLSAIAKRFYGHAGEYRRIAAANGIANPDLIHPGQQLVIPA